MKAKIHKFEQGGHYILLDINSGAVHVVDKMIYDMMDSFDGTNDEAVVAALKALADEGKLPVQKVADAIAKYGINADKINPLYA